MNLICCVRKIKVKATPEEIVRQQLLYKMTRELNYSPSSIVIEKSLTQLPHLALTPSQEIPKRRADIIIMAKGIHEKFELYPLLLIECKSIKLTENVIRQVAGYNHYLKAHFIAIANETTIFTGKFSHKAGEYKFLPYLPRFEELMKITLINFLL